MSDNLEIGQLKALIEACRLCRDCPMGEPLPHAPKPVVRLSSTARLCIAGQAPGMRVHKTGIPFNDPSGDRLRDWMGIDRGAFYDQTRVAIVPMGFCFPGYDNKGGDLPPRRECVKAWHEQVFAAMPQIELILAIGQYAQRYHLGKARERTLTETVKKAATSWNPALKPRILPLPHPSWRNSAWLKKNPWFERDVLPLLKEETENLLL